MGATTTHVLYHGSAIHAEYDPTWTTPTRLYVHGPGVDHPLLTLTGTGPSATVQADHQDGLGSVVALTYSSGGTDARVLYYDPALGRFRSPDPLVPAPGDPQSLNRYS